MTGALCAIFFLSGVSALVFETLWFRQAGLAFGNSVWASSLVLASFMGGIGLGNAAAARLADRVRDPVRAYALLEIAIAIFGVALVLLLPRLGPAIGSALGPLEAQPQILNPVRLLLSFALLLVPSTAMGLTLPLLAKALGAFDPNFGRVLGRLYGWNTFGAMTGVAVSELFLIGALGIRGSALAAGALNLLAAAGALALSARSARTARPAPPEERAAIPPVRWTAGARWLAAAFLSGFALLALEVIWFRFLSMFVLGLSETFALLLGVVLAGIALGGLLASVWLSRDPRAHRFAATIALASGMALVVSYAGSAWVLPYDTRGRVSDALELLRFGIPVMLPVCLLSGVFFTLVGAALREEQRSEAATAGLLTFANTAGAALGPLVGGFVLLPILGMEKSFFLIALLYGAIALLLAAHAAPRGITLGGTAAFVVVAAFFPFGTMRDKHFLEGLDAYMQGAHVVATREGVNETIIYLARMMQGKPLHYRMLTNGHSMSASPMAARRYMKLYVYLPVAIHRDIRSALLISYGIGSTAKALTDSKSIESIDVVDISRDILDMGSIVFPDPAEHPLNDPRVRVHVEDGRYFLQTTTRRFDLITAEPPPPAHAGVVNLYTREYFQLLRDRLSEGGIATYWLPIASVSDETCQAVLRAFCDAFEDCSLWNGMGSNLMMMGTRNARGPVAQELFTRQWRDPIAAPVMEGLGLERPEQLGALFIGDSDFLAEVTEGVAPLTDDRPRRMRPRIPAGVNWQPLFERWANTDAARARFRESEYIARLWPERMRRESLDYFDVQRVINRVGSSPRDRDHSGIADIHELLTETSLSTPVLWLTGGLSDVLRIVDEATPEEAAHPALQYYHGLRLLSERRYAEAVEPVSRGLAVPNLRQDALRYASYALCMSGRCDQAERWARQVFAGRSKPSPVPAFWTWMGENFGLDPYAGDEPP